MISFQRKLLAFFLISTFGYSITSLATFFSIETYFHSIKYLGTALFLRTISSSIFGYNANYIISRLGFKSSFIISQVLGLISIVAILVGFKYHYFSITLLGIALIGLPLTLSTILLTIFFKISSRENEIFRKYSGTRELVFGLARLLACISAPFLLFEYGFNTVLLINTATYLVGIFILFTLEFKKLDCEIIQQKINRIDKLIFKSNKTWIYICQTTSSLLLAAFIPLLSASNQLTLSNNIPPLLRQSLWSIEAVTMILGSIIYLVAKRYREKDIFKTALMLNGAFLLLFLISTSPILIISVTTLISIILMLSFYVFRDDYIINAEHDTKQIEAYAAYSSVQKDLIFSISPVILTYLFEKFGLNNSILIILLLQVVFYICYKFIKTKDVKSFALNN